MELRKKTAVNELGNEEHLPSRYFQCKKKYCVPTLEHVIAIHPLVTELHCLLSTTGTGCNTGLMTISTITGK